MASVIIEQTGDGKQRYHTNERCYYYRSTLKPGERCETCKVLNRVFPESNKGKYVAIPKKGKRK